MHIVIRYPSNVSMVTPIIPRSILKNCAGLTSLAITAILSQNKTELKYNQNIAERTEAIRYRFFEAVETIPTDKEHLSQDKFIRLASTPCSAPALKRAFLFSCLAALRKSDIKKLTWPILFHQSNHSLLLFSMPYKPFLKKPCDFCTFCLPPIHAL